MIKLLIASVIIFILWSAWGFFSFRVEQADYSVLKEMDGYEIREYPEHIVAQTTVDGSFQQSMNSGFSIVAGYIFGDNTKKESIAMTAPVLATDHGNSQTISFGMPRSYSLETLPVPNDPRVEIVMVPAKKYAVLRFSGYRSDTRVKHKQEQLLSLLVHDGIGIDGGTAYAGYNAPWTPPWMNRNEVLVEIEN